MTRRERRLLIAAVLIALLAGLYVTGNLSFFGGGFVRTFP